MQALRQLSAERGRSIADLVRKSVDDMLKESSRESRAQRFLNAAGKFNSGLTDVSQNHDKYLAEDFA